MDIQPSVAPENMIIRLLDGCYPEPLPAAVSGTGRNGIIKVALAVHVPEGTLVRLETGRDYASVGRVLYAVPVAGAYAITIQTQHSERRKHPRIAASEHAQIVSMEPRAPVDFNACVFDVSKSGIGLITGVYVKPYTLTKVVLNDAIVFGIVRHCSRHEPSSFKVGVEIETVIFRELHSKWLFKLKVLWSVLNVASHAFAARLARIERLASRS